MREGSQDSVEEGGEDEENKNSINWADLRNVKLWGFNSDTVMLLGNLSLVIKG